MRARLFPRSAVALGVLLAFAFSTTAAAQDAGNPIVPPADPLRIEVEGRSIESIVEVEFYGNRVPREYFLGFSGISERDFFLTAGDEEAARRSRNHRALTIALGTMSMVGFFTGLLLFGAADEVDYSLGGLPKNTNGRILSLQLVGGSLVPAFAIAFRRQSWSRLDYAFAVMSNYNDR